MRQKQTGRSSERIIKDIKRKTRRQYSAEEKIRIVLDGLRGEDSIAELCRREGISQGIYYKWSKDFMEAGKKRLAGDIVRQANSSEVTLFTEIEPVFERITDLKVFAKKLAGSQKGRLRFAMTPAFGLEVAPKALAEFSKLHTDVTIEVETLHASEVIKALQDNTIDTGLIFDAPNAPGIDSKIIGRTDFVCVAPIDLKLPASIN